MNYYDEEIIIAGPDTKNLSTVKVNRLNEGARERSGSRNALDREGLDASANAGRRSKNHMKARGMLQSSQEDGLLQDLRDQDDEDDFEINDDPKPSTSRQAEFQRASSLARQHSSRFDNLPTAKVIDNDSDQSESDSDGGLDATIAVEALTPKKEPEKRGTLFDFPLANSRIPSASAEGTLKKQSSIDESNSPYLDITPEKWEQLSVHQEIKDLFPYILKYTPQHIEVPYRLQPFIPEYIPAVGDVDAFLKVTTPQILDKQREQELNDHLRKLGLYFLDEPAGEQSQPSLLNMKLRSVLTGRANPRSASAALIPTAKSPKDIDKWIVEVEQVHMSQSVLDVQPRKDIEPLLVDWPREYAMAAPAVQNAYQRCMQNEIDLPEYVRILSEQLGIEGRLDTQADYISNVQTFFALYLAANQAWE